jgi:hypothetical protein
VPEKKFNPDALAKRLKLLEQKRNAAKKSHAPKASKPKLEAQNTRLEAVITYDPKAFYLPPDETPETRNSSILRRQRQRLRRSRNGQAFYAFIWSVVALLCVWWFLTQLKHLE